MPLGHDDTPLSKSRASATGAPRCGPAPRDEALLARIETHPCYSEAAHRRYARMHVAVAPACNIQCNYCNRKFDCASESRPGVVSELLTPEQAVRKVAAVAARIPQLTVVGVAGPGDPLANPERTFETLRRVAAERPGLKLCLSTNGLALPEYVDEIAALGVDHVTLTVNALDPFVAARVYAWVNWEGRRLTGEEGAALLIRRQLESLDLLVARGILVKVNSVLIPGVNDLHLPAVSRLIRARGAFVHNVMPLISAPEHGTVFGLEGRRGPTAAELAAVRDLCGAGMNVMRHCRQCRADAVGMLFDDRHAEFTMDRVAAMEAADARPVAPVRIAVTSVDGRRIDRHFGQADRFLVYEVSNLGVRLAETREVAAYCRGPEACAAGAADDDPMAPVLAALEGCAAVLSARIGREPWERLEAAGIRPGGDHAWEAVEPAVAAVAAELAAAERPAVCLAG